MTADLARDIIEKYKSDGFKFTDIGNGERLIARHGHDLHFYQGNGSAKNRTWFVWNGRYWEADAGLEVRRRAKDTIHNLYLAAADYDDGLRRDAQRWAVRSEEARRIDGLIRCAEAEAGVEIKAADLNADPWLLNCENGILNLQTGRLLKHDRKYLMTKIAPVEYHADAVSEVWDAFLHTATRGDEDVKAFLCRAAGYSLTGDTGEEKFFFLHGPPGTGKSTFLDALKGILGDYSKTADFDTLVVRHFAGGVRDDIARLFDARLVTAIEIEEGQKLAEGLVAQLTGRDDVTARELYAKAVECRPKFKLWIAANKEPIIHGSDSPIWRRVARVPFEHVVAEADQDPNVKTTIREDAAARAAILAWAVRGCREWQKTGLAVPAVIKMAVADYKISQDVIAEFKEDCCVIGAAYRTDRDAIIRAYNDYCEEHHVRQKDRLSSETFKRRLAADFPLSRSGNRRIFNGIGLKTEQESQLIEEL